MRIGYRKIADSTGVNVPQALRNGGVTVVRQVFGLLSGLIISSLFSHLASKEVYGSYTFILSVIGIASISTLPGLNIAVLRGVARGEERIYNRALRWSFLSGLIGSLLIILATFIFPKFFHGGSLAMPLTLAALLMPFYYGFNTWDSFLAGRRQFPRAALYSSVQAALTACLTGLAIYKHAPLIVIVLAFVGTAALANSVYAFLTARQARGGGGQTSDLWFGVHLTWINALPSVSDFLDRVILGIYLGPALLADYAIAALFPDALKNNLRAILNIFSPQLAAGNVRSNSKIIRRNATTIFGVGLLMTTTIWVLAPLLISSLFGGRYHNVVHLSQLLGLVLFFKPLNVILANIVIFDGGIKNNTALSIVPSLLRIGSYPFLLPHYGLTGLVMALVFQELVAAAIAVTALRRRIAGLNSAEISQSGQK